MEFPFLIGKVLTDGTLGLAGGNITFPFLIGKVLTQIRRILISNAHVHVSIPYR